MAVLNTARASPKQTDSMSPLPEPRGDFSAGNEARNVATAAANTKRTKARTPRRKRAGRIEFWNTRVDMKRSPSERAAAKNEGGGGEERRHIDDRIENDERADSRRNRRPCVDNTLAQVEEFQMGRDSVDDTEDHARGCGRGRGSGERGELSAEEEHRRDEKAGEREVRGGRDDERTEERQRADDGEGCGVQEEPLQEDDRKPYAIVDAA